MSAFPAVDATVAFSFGHALTMKPRATHKVVSADGVSLSVQEWGAPGGRPVLLLHAFGMTNLGWLPITTGPLSKTHRFVTFDHRGHGGSGKPTAPEAYGGERFADDIAAVIDALALERPAIVAWSMSGALFGDYLAKYGDANIDRIVLIGAANALGQPMIESGQLGPIFGDERSNLIHATEFGDQFLGFAVVNDGLTDADMDADAWALIQAGSMQTPVGARAAILFRPADHLDLYARAAAPVLTIHSAHDPIVTTKAPERLIAQRADVQSLRFPGRAHAPHWEHAAAVNDALARFLGARTH